MENKWSVDTDSVIAFLEKEGREKFLSPARLEAIEANREKSKPMSALEGDNTIRMFGPICSQRTAAIERWLYGPDADVCLVDDFITGLGNISGNFTILVNSEGGNVLEASAIRTVIQERIKGGDEVTVHNIGLMASAATWVATDAQKKIISDGATYMIHEASLTQFNFGRYRVEDYEKQIVKMQKRKEWLEGINESLLDSYVKQTGKDRKELSQMLNDETFLVGKKAVDEGFFDEVYTVDDVEDVENAVELALRREERMDALYAELEADDEMVLVY